MNQASDALSLSHVRFFVTPWTGAHQATLSRQEYCPPPGDLPNTGIEPSSPALQADSLPSKPPGKPLGSITEYTEEINYMLLCYNLEIFFCS